MIPFAYHYRRRHFDGIHAIAITSGTALARRDDAQVGVFDYLIAGPMVTDSVSGRRGTATVTIARPKPLAVRLWLWPDRPLRLFQFFDAAGATTVYRVDFATYPRRYDHTVYQTDLYLDLFATPDERDYAILDEDELEIAHGRGLIDDQVQSAILSQAEQLAELLERRGLGAWLAGWCATPFEVAALGEKPDWAYHHYAPGDPDGWPKE
jgi:predicted RNA-binding protein associated with RNAse of E/G family